LSGGEEFVEALAFEHFHDDVGASVVESAPGVDLRNVRIGVRWCARPSVRDAGF
jgi:hypothetical protein